ncbi:MAG: D-isomer specific 2-hydroxyacid dehydrogenase family protein [Eubacteriales bacterium]|nr:D-isomer specific 2-hydroxyacid dehydrogenase family protein [Eubacteriales bacterium]
MKICAYEVRNDERKDFRELEQRLGVKIELHSQVPETGNAEFVKGCEGVTILGQGDINAKLLDCWKEKGVRYLSTRTVGMNHIDVEHAKSIGIQVCNASYPPSGVAEFTLMLMLMCLRNYKQALWRGQVNDFSLDGLMGMELGELTVGVVGTGRIGFAVIRLLSSFGCRILAYNRTEKESIRKYAEYVDLDTLYAKSDIITLHVPLTENTYHMINGESLKKMKDGVVIINCARGELAENDALIEGIESGKIGALGLDVVEDETGITHVDHRIDILSNQKMAYLRQFRNVVMTPHMAFYTETAVRNMVRCGVQGILYMA